MKNEQDFYKLLGITPNADAHEIERAYRELAFQYHPDRHHGHRAAKGAMQMINKAYDTLSNPIKRREYDIPRGYRTLVPKFKKGSTVRVDSNSTSPYRAHTGIVDQEPLKDNFRFWYTVKLTSRDYVGVARFAEEELEEVSEE